MIWVNLLAIIILVLSFFGGLREGAVKRFFSLVVLLIAIPLAGYSYRLIAAVLSFLPGENWENFIAFFITFALINVIFHLIFLLPRKIVQGLWRKGLLSRLLGGALNILDAGIGLVVFTLVVGAYPIFDWLARWVAGSGVLSWLVDNLSFVPAMLPEVFQQAVTSAVTII